jgi:hypothetical protein
MRKAIAVCFAMLLVVSVFSGCATFDKMSGKEDTPKPKPELPNQAFYGFPDIPVPKELTYAPNKSFVYETQSMRMGVLVFSGNVELQSLEDYFKLNMVKNGWRFVNSFRFRGDIAMNFTKEDKTANIKMSRDSFTSEVEIWVGPAASMEKGSAPKGNGPAKRSGPVD